MNMYFVVYSTVLPVRLTAMSVSDWTFTP